MRTTLRWRLSLGVLFSRVFVYNIRILVLLVNFMDHAWLARFYAGVGLVSRLAAVEAGDSRWSQS
jgi:hypothetical protein